MFIPLVFLACAAAAALALGSASVEQRAAVGFAATVCAVGVVAAWAALRACPPSPAGRVSGSLAAVALRLLPALAAMAWLQATDSRPLRGGAAGYLVIFYLTTLAAEVIRVIMAGRGAARRRGDSDEI